jgi:CheY-like chemotaxis protein
MVNKKQKKILLIEDDLDQILMYRIKFESMKFSVVDTHDEGTIVKTIKKEKPDLILLDMLLEDSFGLDILKKIKKNKDTKDCKVVILSNFKQKGLINKCLEAGAMGYLLKDKYVPSEIVEKVNKYLK